MLVVDVEWVIGGSKWISRSPDLEMVDGAGGGCGVGVRAVVSGCAYHQP